MVNNFASSEESKRTRISKIGKVHVISIPVRDKVMQSQGNYHQIIAKNQSKTHLWKHRKDQ